MDEGIRGKRSLKPFCISSKEGVYLDKWRIPFPLIVVLAFIGFPAQMSQ